MTRLILFNKPYQVLSQFTDGEGRKTLADYINIPAVDAAGRLDRDSEGLLLTDDGKLQQRLSNPRYKAWKTYLVEVEGIPQAKQITRLQQGASSRMVTLCRQKHALSTHTGQHVATPSTCAFSKIDPHQLAGNQDQEGTQSPAKTHDRGGRPADIATDPHAGWRAAREKMSFMTRQLETESCKIPKLP